MHRATQQRNSLSGENVLLMILTGGIIFLMLASFFVSLMFDFRHTKGFAIQELKERGFAQVSVLNEYTIGHGMGIPSFPIEDWFDFMGIENGIKVQKRLICHRQYWDIEKSRCEISAKS